MKRVGYNIEAHKIDAKDLGVLQSRKRIIIIGWRKDLEFTYPAFNPIVTNYTVNDILNDLPKLRVGEIYREFNYRNDVNKCLVDTKIRNNGDIVTHHVSRNHTKRDLEVYRLALDKWNRERARIKYTDLSEYLRTHKNQTSFLDRFKVVAGNEKYSHTIVVHISRDGHHYIHPDLEQNRSLTVREAARIQSFPDNYFFEGPRTANSVQIGNAVPPLMAEKIALWFRRRFNEI